ncbi:MAG: type II secretion system protein [Chloroflexi bacterium]|nr:type II secretion system protein [Chloroflexota bacterium]
MGKAAKGLVRGAPGFTLVEVLVAVGIITLALGLVGTSVFQALSVERYWREDVVATRQLRHAGSWFAGDALNASSTGLVDGAPAVSAVTLTWTDRLGVPHIASYSILEGDLVRNFDGSQTVVARRVESVGFSLSGRVLTLELTVPAEQGGTDTTTLTTYLRMLQ